MTDFEIAGPITPYIHHAPTTPRAKHGFFGTSGGVSTGVYTSLNCGFGSSDDPALVTRNRGRVAASLDLPEDRLAAVYQIHSADVVTVSEGAPVDRNLLVRADGLVTTVRGLGLTILTADCLPLLLVDSKGAVIGACHAGWRGAASGIVENTLGAMRQAGAGTITALIGPTIRQPSYQVGVEMHDEVMSRVGPAIRDAAAACFIPDGTGRFRFDLAGLVRHQLHAASVELVHDCGVDTYAGTGGDGADSHMFFSHRRATHAGDTDCGRQIAVISLPTRRPTRI